MTDSLSLAAPSLRRRMASLFYEGFLAFAIALATAFVFSVVIQMRHALHGRLALIAVIWLVLGLYFTWSWGKGRTLPMQTWRIRIVDAHGRPVTRARAWLRYATCSLWVIPPVAFFAQQRVSDWKPVFYALVAWVLFWALLSRFHPQRQFWHDVLAGTRLVDAPSVTIAR
ncbi:RDD family protein [Ramlibacter sp. XY19]|uniref:RDD family protein n=1 Tax=Ramlibacter paludis TaxID=2908000 RepID=UPI0023DCD13C|nr:RDD family protein [Ramlibacter paludis]MCG2593291.1 RDD family protein [Ramlibacter paludis]